MKAPDSLIAALFLVGLSIFMSAAAIAHRIREQCGPLPGCYTTQDTVIIGVAALIGLIVIYLASKLYRNGGEL